MLSEYYFCPCQRQKKCPSNLLTENLFPPKNIWFQMGWAIVFSLLFVNEPIALCLGFILDAPVFYYLRGFYLQTFDYMWKREICGYSCWWHSSVRFTLHYSELIINNNYFLFINILGYWHIYINVVSLVSIN